MKDQDQEVDEGATGTGTTARGGAAGTTVPTEPSAAAASNVVPFPRNWYGSVDELVPIHPAPERAAGSEAPRGPEASTGTAGGAPRAVAPAPVAPRPVTPSASRRVASQPAAAPPATVAPVHVSDASAFWDGETTTVQEAVSSGPIVDVSYGPVVDASVADGTGPDSADPRAWRPRLRRSRILAGGVVLVALAVGGALLVADVVSSGRSAHTGGTLADGGHGTAVVDQTVSEPVTVATTQSARTTDHHHARARAGTEQRSDAGSRVRAGSRAGAGRKAGVKPSSHGSRPSHQSTPRSKESQTPASTQSPEQSSAPEQVSTTTVVTSTLASSTSPTSAASSRSAGSSCAESPDSGCLP